jgi:hypothetical protein
LREIVHLAWDRFNIIGSVIGDVQSRILITAFYFTILVPFGLISRLFTDPLRRTGTPVWLDRPATPDDLDSARQQG